MALLAEYALTPDVFDIASYNNDEVCALHLQNLKEVLLHEGLVRNLRDGEWLKVFNGDHRPWHRRGKELLKKLAVQKRLLLHQVINRSTPISDADWCNEALGSHKMLPLNGIIVTDCIAGKFCDQPLVAPVHKLPVTSWWAERSPSVRLNRALIDYQTHLDLVLRHANSIMFIDPFIDPKRVQYKDFIQLVQMAGNRTPAPLIEVHRVCYRGSGPSRKILNRAEIETAFRDQLSAPIKSAGLTMKVFIWDDFHDRYLISDLIGISLPNGFDTTNAPNALTTWTRLGRKERDDIQKEFDIASNRHALRGHFTIS